MNFCTPKELFDHLRRAQREMFFARLRLRNPDQWRRPTHYFVDYENVQGIDCIEGECGEQDRLIIIRTINTKPISHEIAEKLTRRPNDFTLYSDVGPEYADNFLITLLCFDIALNKSDCQYVVVSKDNEFSLVNELICKLYGLEESLLSVISPKPPIPAKPIRKVTLLSEDFPRFMETVQQANLYSDSEEKRAKLREAWVKCCDDSTIPSNKSLCQKTLVSALDVEGQELYRILTKNFDKLN